MTKLLIEGAEILHQDSNSIDKVMRYLDDNLATLNEYLNEDNFNRTLDIFWENLSKILYEIYQSNLNVSNFLSSTMLLVSYPYKYHQLLYVREGISHFHHNKISNSKGGLSLSLCIPRKTENSYK